MISCEHFCFIKLKITILKKNFKLVKMINKYTDQVTNFHKAFEIEFSKKPTVEIKKNIIDLRFNLMDEENKEYKIAAENNDIVEVADALGDMLYILCGTLITHGMQNIIDDVFDEIQKSNMSKLDNEGKPIYRDDGKVLKGPNYFKPNIRKFFS